MNQSLHYQERQRDYTPLGTIELLWNYNRPEMAAELVGYQTAPSYIVVRDGVLYHFFTLEDEVGRARAWAERFGHTDIAHQVASARTAIAAHFKLLATAGKTPPLQAIEALFESYWRLFPILVAAIWVPEHASDQVDPKVLKELLKLRHEGETVYKEGEGALEQLLTRLEVERSLEPSTLRWLTRTEFDRYLADGTLPDVRKRRAFLLVEASSDGERAWDDPSALQAFPFLETTVDTSISELSGQTASPGMALGRVRIINKVSELPDFQEGEILLASMTDPRYLPAMKRAAAIVTNEGGVTCHAAIVSRELGIPCVISTKIATKVFKTGDTINVDATNGVVQKVVV